MAKSNWSRKKEWGIDDDSLSPVAKRISNLETRFSNVGITPPATKQDKSFLLKALEVLDVPREFVVKGLTGKERVADTLTGIKNRIARGVLGFIGDVALDPLTYLTLGAGGVAKSAAVQGGKSLVAQSAINALEQLAKQEGKTFLKFAGQNIADVTPIAKGFGSALEKTGLPEKMGPVFNSRYVRKSVTSPEEMGDVTKGVNLIFHSPRQAKGEQEIALNELAKQWQGVTPEVAQKAASVIEAPTQLAIKRGNVLKNDIRKLLTGARNGSTDQGLLAKISNNLPNELKPKLTEALNLAGTVSEKGKPITHKAIINASKDIGNAFKDALKSTRLIRK